MKSKIQMQVAKHMIAVWLEAGKKESLNDAFYTIEKCWPGLPRRTLRVWAKALYKNPERYEFTGFGYRKLDLADYFNSGEIKAIVQIIENMPDTNTIMQRGMYRSIAHHKYMYGLDSPSAIQAGIGSYFGTEKRRFRPAKPVLKPIK